jgi:hypothetical protein
MATKRRAQRKRLQFREFVAKYGAEINSGQALDESTIRGDSITNLQGWFFPRASSSPRDYSNTTLQQMLIPLAASSVKPMPMPWDQVAESWFGKLLKKAARSNEPEVVGFLLRLFLIELSVKPVQGVLAEFAKNPGARETDFTKKIRDIWEQLKAQLGRDPTGTELACKILGRKKFMRLGLKRRHRERNKFTQAVRRGALRATDSTTH